MNNNNTRLYGMLGFAMRAGKVVIGTNQVIAALQARGAGAVQLVLISSDASEGTTKKLTFKCEFYKKTVKKIDIDSAEFGRLLGKLNAPVAVAITDARFAEEILLAMGEKITPSVDKNQKRKESSQKEDR